MTQQTKNEWHFLLIETIIPCVIALALLLWLRSWSDKKHWEEIAEYERLTKELGHPPQYYVCGIPVNWTPYDE